MKTISRSILISLFAGIASCEPAPPSSDLSVCRSGEVGVVAADSSGRFQYPYVLRFPECDEEISHYLVVEPNNTGTVSDDLDVHFEAAVAVARKSSVGKFVAEQLNAPLLVPVFPRPETNWTIYTHALDRDSLLVSQGPMMRIDLQLIAMIDDARSRLAAAGIDVSRESLFTGFSASGTFVNRFAALHPERVRALAAGGLNGIAILPSQSVAGVDMNYPLGVNDLESLTGQAFQRELWLDVPQYLFMGADDTNDAVDYDDGYSDAERDLVHRVISKRMQPDRWLFVQREYELSGAAAVFVTYDGIGHATNRAINTDIAEFLAAHSTE